MDFTRFKAAVFDLDGTLIRSKHVWSDIDVEFFRKRGYEVPADYGEKVSVMDFNTASVYTKELLGLPESPEEIQQEWHDMAVHEYTHVIGEVDGAVEFLRYLDKKGIKLGLATANKAPLYEPVLKRLGVYELFDGFATTSEVEHGKGHPDVYELACERLGVKACDTIVFEDLPEGIKGAKLGGFHTAACLDDLTDSEYEAMQKEADIVFRDYHELMK